MRNIGKEKKRKAKQNFVGLFYETRRELQKGQIVILDTLVLLISFPV